MEIQVIMTEALDGTASVILGEKVIDNVYHCTITIFGRTEQVLAQKFSNRYQAERCVERLNYLNFYCTYFARGKFTCSDKDGQGIAVIELATSSSKEWVAFNKWVLKEHLNFYRYGRNPSTGERECRGVGNTFKRVFGQVAQVMNAMHKLGKVHGNILNGVFIDDAQNVRVANVVVFEDKDDSIFGLLNDLKCFKILIKRAIVSLPKPDSAFPFRSYIRENDVLVDEIDLFLGLFGPILSSSFNTAEGFYEKARWIYNGFIFWNIKKTYHFFHTINEFLDDNATILEEALFLADKFHDWRQHLSSFTFAKPSNLKNVAAYMGPNELQENNMYSYPYGIVRFTENTYKHLGDSQTKLDSLKEVFSVFPHLPGTLYCEVAFVLGKMVYASGRPKMILKYGGKSFSELLWDIPYSFMLGDFESDFEDES